MAMMGESSEKKAERPEIAPSSLVPDLLSRSFLPRSYHWLYTRCDDQLRLCLPSTLDALLDEQVVELAADGNWQLRNHGFPPLSGDDVRRLIGPVWEPMFAERLKSIGLPIVQQLHVCGYYLDIAVEAGGCRLDVEVDGRQHYMLRSQRIRDIVRDARLKTAGWKVLRVRVSDLINDVEACEKRVVDVWNGMKEKGALS